MTHEKWIEETIGISLCNEDCFDVFEIFKKYNFRFDAIVVDPPYNIDIDKWDNGFNIVKAIEISSKFLKPGGNLILFQGWSNVVDTISGIKNIEDLTLKNWIIWDRIKGRGAKTNFVSTREDILWYIKNGADYTFNKTPSTIKKKTGGLGTKNGESCRALSNVWTDISPIVPWSKERVSHPTQKPLSLMERIITIFTNENDFVLDFTMGSGSTGVACKKLKRSFFGIESNEDYYKIADERISGTEMHCNE